MGIAMNASLRSLRRNWTSSNHLVHKFISRKRSKTAFVNLQSNVKVLEIVKFGHKDHPSPSQCATSSPKTSSSTRSKLFAMKIARNASPKPLDKSITNKAPRSHEPKRWHQMLLARKSINCVRHKKNYQKKKNIYIYM